MAAMQHGLPIVSTAGPSTDRLLALSGAIELVPCSQRDAFAHTAVRLIRDHAQRLALGASARALYREHFDWPVIAEALARHLGDAATWTGSRSRRWDTAASPRSPLPLPQETRSAADG
jgi:glycosyltransferase involved in cell wall biosynthesis